MEKELDVYIHDSSKKFRNEDGSQAQKIYIGNSVPENLDVTDSLGQKEANLFSETDVCVVNESAKRGLEKSPRRDLYHTIEKLGLKNKEFAQEGLAQISSLSASNVEEIEDSHSVIHSLSSSYDKTEPLFELPNQGKVSSNFCETESLASMSQSGCSEDYNLMLPLPSKIPKKKKKKRSSVAENLKRKNQESKYCRPNYFVGIQVSNPEIHKAVVEIQNRISSFNEKLSPALVDVATLHITLLVAYIPEEKDLHVACSALDHCAAALSSKLSDPPLHLKFSGISHFSHKIIYIKIVEGEGYRRLVEAAEVVRSTFSTMGVHLPDERAFNPHLTIAKLPKLPRERGQAVVREIDPRSYDEYVNKWFGEQVVARFQLLSMDESRDANGYYCSVRDAYFDVSPRVPARRVITDKWVGEDEEE